MSTINQVDNWLGKKMESMEDIELCRLFEEIDSFRRTGLLQEKGLRALEKEFSENVSHTSYGECMRLVEDEVLFEMSRRFFNQKEKDKDNV